MAPSAKTILIAYDGSDNAKAAIAQAGTLFAGTHAVVLTVWETFGDIVARSPASLGVAGISDFERIDDEARNSALHSAEEGAALARDSGLDASATVRSRVGTVAQTVLSEAEAANAEAIVVGSRGLGGVGSFLLGSVSHALLQSADRAVVVVPSPEVVERRAEKRRDAER